jgi:hypothetical protein
VDLIRDPKYTMDLAILVDGDAPQFGVAGKQNGVLAILRENQREAVLGGQLGVLRAVIYRAADLVERKASNDLALSSRSGSFPMRWQVRRVWPVFL